MNGLRRQDTLNTQIFEQEKLVHVRNFHFRRVDDERGRLSVFLILSDFLSDIASAWTEVFDAPYDLSVEPKIWAKTVTLLVPTGTSMAIVERMQNIRKETHS